MTEMILPLLRGVWTSNPSRMDLMHYCDNAGDLIEALSPFLALWADRYQRDHELDGLHPTHYDLLARTGARMAGFKRATNASTREQSKDGKP